MKRLLDIVLSFIGLLVASPIMVLISVLLRLDSSGDTFFSQKRLGKGGKIFKIHKFRKFPQDWGTKGSGVTTQNDVRMTTFGAFLERTKLDELPQLWNILKGEMSFVGPRPESLRYEALFEGEFKHLLDYTPGIFGPNQVAFRNESAMYPADEDPEEFYKRELFPQKARNDLAYFANATIFSDISWMFKSTVGVLLGVFDWKRVVNRYGFIVLMDLVLFQIAWFLAHVFRFEGFNLSPANMDVYTTGCWLIPLVVLPLMMMGGVYRHPFRYFSVKDVKRLFVVSSTAWVIATFVQFGFFQRNLSVGIAMLSGVLFLSLLIMPRLFRRERWLREHPKVALEGRKALIIGADKKGTALVKFLEQGFSNISVVGYVDEDPNLHGRYINGAKVLGVWRDIDEIYERYSPSEVWFLDGSGDKSLSFTELKSWCDRKGLKSFSVQKLFG